jgi:glycosyltransferase involved in cell wall biosynthesis
MSLLLVEPEDFTKPLYGGGGAAVVGQILRSCGEHLAVVGMTSGSHAIGRWTYADICGRRRLFLPVIHRARVEKTVLVSRVLRFAVALAEHRRALREIGVRSVFTQTWAVLWFFAFWPGRWDLCYYYPGLHNSIRHGRHRVLGPICAGPYAFIHSLAVRRADRVLAAASLDAIARHQMHLRRLGTRIEIHPLPTATDVALFKPQPPEVLRPRLGLPLKAPVYIYVGRLAAIKGVPLILTAFQIVRRSRPDALLLIAGDGEERSGLTKLAHRLRIAPSVRFLGMLLPAQVAQYLAAADAGLFASYEEGFSVAMVELLACGRPIVSTDVSGARDLIVEGKNGFVLPNRDVPSYARRMLDVLDLPSAGQFGRELAVAHYSRESLWARLQRAWPPFAASAGGPCAANAQPPRGGLKAEAPLMSFDGQLP